MKLNMTRRIAGVSLLLLLAVLGILATQDDLRPQVEETMNDLQARLDALPSTREPVGGAARVGLAWEKYWEASAMLKARSAGLLDGISRASVDACEAGPEERRAESARMAPLIAPELTMLREAARRRDISPVRLPDDPIDAKTLFLRDVRATNNLLGLLGVAELESGQQAEGVATLLDAMQISQDYMRSRTLINQLIGSSEVIPKSLEQVLSTEGFGVFSADAIGAFEAGVESLIEHTPLQPNYLGELEFTGRMALGDPNPQMFPPRSLVDQILGLSPSLAEEFTSAYELALTLDSLSSRAALNLLQSNEQVEKRARSLTRHWDSIGISNRQAVVRLQMLHHALRLAQGLEPTPFADPFEMPLSLTETDDSWVLGVGAAFNAEPIIKTFRKGLSED
jgi:hypothetical protein